MLIGALTACLALLLTGQASAQDPDALARRGARQAIEQARTARHRDLYRITLPPGPVPLPARYEVRLEAHHINTVPGSMTILFSRTAAGAAGEWLTPTGIFRGPVPGAELDSAVRQAFYLLGAEQALKRTNLGIAGHGYTSHFVVTHVEIRGPGLTLDTGVHQPTTRELDLHDEVSLLAHGLVSASMRTLAERHLRPNPVTLSPSVLVELRERLRTLPRGSTPMQDYRRDDRAAVLGRLLAHHLAQTDDRTLVPLLHSQGLHEAARALALRTSRGSRRLEVLAHDLCHAEHSIFAPALSMAVEGGPASRPAVRAAFACEHDEYNTAKLIEALEAMGLVRADLPLLTSLRSPPSHLLVRVAAARALARLGSKPARSFLEEAAFQPPADAMPEPQRRAVEALAQLPNLTPEERRALAGRVAALLARIPLSAHATYSGMDLLVRALGRLGPAEHMNELARILDHSDASVVVTAISAMAEVDQARALRQIRRRIQIYADGRSTGIGYSWDVDSYLELLLLWDARQALPELRAAVVRLRADDVEPHRLPELTSLIRYLAARRGRVPHLLRLARARGDLGDQLEPTLLARHRAEGLGRAQLEAAFAERAAESRLW